MQKGELKGWREAHAEGCAPKSRWQDMDAGSRFCSINKQTEESQALSRRKKSGVTHTLIHIENKVKYNKNAARKSGRLNAQSRHKFSNSLITEGIMSCRLHHAGQWGEGPACTGLLGRNRNFALFLESSLITSLKEKLSLFFEPESQPAFVHPGCHGKNPGGAHTRDIHLPQSWRPEGTVWEDWFLLRLLTLVYR
jgi:hypothetical protein